jgi:lipoprotein-anchoring transpeptidase ErfK/SrfK
LTAAHAAVNQAIRNASIAQHSGNKRAARRWAEQAVLLGREQEEPWLILANTASPHARIAYIEQALKINPGSLVAQKALQQARHESAAPVKPGLSLTPAARQRIMTGVVVIEELAAVLWVALALFTWRGDTAFAQSMISRAAGTFSIIPGSSSFKFEPPATSVAAFISLFSSTSTPTATATSTSTQTATITSTPTSTATLTPTSTPTETPTSTPTSTPLPTKTPHPTQIPTISGPKSIIVDIPQQHLYAYEGNRLVFSFVASTGSSNSTWAGNFSILDKIPDAYSDPWGFWMPDWMGIYWAGDVEDGFHSLPVLDNGQQIWGDEIGEPITYGCIVLEPGDMQQLYNWAIIGTSVQIK